MSGRALRRIGCVSMLAAMAALPACARDCRPSSGASSTGAKADYRLLFIGNSYTFVHDMPGHLRDLGHAVTPPVEIAVQESTVGGATLHEAYERAGVRDLIAHGGFSHVVLQDQSTDTLREPADFLTYAGKLVDDVRQAHATPVLYQTWARQPGDDFYQYKFTGGNAEAMQAKIDQMYDQAASASGGVLVARVGDARALVMKRNVAVNLYEPDGSHPSAAGAYLAACVFFRRITGRAVSGAKAPADLSADVASELQAVADQM